MTARTWSVIEKAIAKNVIISSGRNAPITSVLA
jgi:hypothetical protein